MKLPKAMTRIWSIALLLLIVTGIIATSEYRGTDAGKCYYNILYTITYAYGIYIHIIFRYKYNLKIGIYLLLVRHTGMNYD